MTAAEAADLILIGNVPHSRSEARAILAGPGDGEREGEGDEEPGDEPDTADFPPDMGDPGAEWGGDR